MNKNLIAQGVSCLLVLLVIVFLHYSTRYVVRIDSTTVRRFMTLKAARKHALSIPRSESYQVCAYDSWHPENSIVITHVKVWAMGTFVSEGDHYEE